MIAVVDYGMGNRRSVEKAIEHVGVPALITRDHDELRAADALVLPGVGAFPRAMDNLHELGLTPLLTDWDRPLLGICLGMQLLFERSDEHGGGHGLGLIPGTVKRLQAPGLSVPHIGWNLVSFDRPSPLTAGLPVAGCPFYHVHSLAAHPANELDVVGTAQYGEPFATIVQRGNVFGVQFHPEKSSLDGLTLLRNFVRLASPAGVAPAAGRA